MKEKLRGRDAFTYAFDNYTDMVYRIAVHNTLCEADAEDITQEAMLRLLDNSRSFNDAEHLKAWLIRVTVNLCRNLNRSSARTQEADECLTAPETHPGESILSYVKQLPENYRNAIYLHYYEGYSAKEIADILSSRQNTVLSWLSRGRELLREMMGEDFDDE